MFFVQIATWFYIANHHQKKESKKLDFLKAIAIISLDMKENTLYARIVMVLLAVNVAFTGYVVYRLNDTTQDQIDSVSQTETTQTTPAVRQETQPTTVDEVTPEAE